MEIILFMMTKAIGSKIWLDKGDPIGQEFKSCVEDLMKIEDVKNLNNYTQHLNTSRLQHSINVAYYSYFVCKKLGLDFRSAARGGILHDLYLYNWRVEKQPEGSHVVAHPKVALRTAKKNVTLNPIETDCIVKHMWPLTFASPKYPESFLLSCMDKYCTVLEVGHQAFWLIFGRWKFVHILVNGGVFVK